eukprot:gene21177-25483_t
MPGALDRLAQFALLLGGHRSDAARHDLAPFGHETLQQAHILVIDLGRALARERAALAAAEKRTGHGLFPFAFATTRAFAVVLAHHHRRAGFQFVHADGQETDHVFVDRGLAFQFRNDARRGIDVQQHKVRLAVLLDLVGQRTQAPGFDLGDLALVGFHDFGGGGGKRVDLSL